MNFEIGNVASRWLNSLSLLMNLVIKITKEKTTTPISLLAIIIFYHQFNTFYHHRRYNLSHVF